MPPLSSAGLTPSTSHASLAHAHERAAGHDHVEYVLLAEFDIDQGSLLRHQYPAPTGTDEHLLAEHMLPDGAHDRPEDWTVFYLNQVPGLIVDPAPLAQARADLKGKARAVDQDASAAAAVDDGGDAVTAAHNDGGLLFVMSLVRTKKDASVRRGALVKALAVAARNPYIQIFKPILLLALEDYFNSPSVDVLANLYASLNAMETSALPLLGAPERIILRTSDRKDFFDDRFAAAVAASERRERDDEGLLVRSMPSLESLASVLRSPSVGTAASASREDVASLGGGGGVGGGGTGGRSSRANTVSSLGDDGRSSWSHGHGHGHGSGFAPPVPGSGSGSGAGQVPYLAPTRQDSGATRSTSSLVGSSGSPTLVRGHGFGNGAGAAARPKDTHFFETKIAYNGIALPVRIPMATFPSEVGDYSLIKLVQTFSSPTALTPSPFHPHLHTSGHTTTPALIVLFNALLAGHRVVFLGHGQPAGRVAELVLAACAMVSGCGAVLPGVEARAFPYTNLANLDNLEQVDGFIAGVCNPAFADRPSWWDVLCNIETGKVTISRELKPLSLASSPSATATLSAAAGGGGGGGGGTVGRSTGARASDFASWTGGRGSSVGGPAGGGAGPGMDGVDELGQLGGSGSGGVSGATSGAPGRSDGKESQDVVFMEEILISIQAHYGEAVIRARFIDYVSRFVRLASRYEEDSTSATTIGFASAPFTAAGGGALGSGIVFADEAAGAREVAANGPRIEAWMRTPSYHAHQAAFRQAQLDSPFSPSFDLVHQLARLRLSRAVSPPEAVLILRTLCDVVRTDAQIISLLAHLPAHFGGLLPLAFGLFHPSPEARHYTLELFDRLALHPTGAKVLSSLNAFHRLAYTRLVRERERDAAADRDRERERVRDEVRTGGGGGGGGGGGREREETARPGR
ncbi:hypothetical protein JCM9279_001167 [Rhodotorula babjevae]